MASRLARTASHPFASRLARIASRPSPLANRLSPGSHREPASVSLVSRVSRGSPVFRPNLLTTDNSDFTDRAARAAPRLRSKV
jgi:hypothetical protein